MIDYLDLELLITRAGEGYRARIIDSPGGQAASDFMLPFADAELRDFRRRLERPRYAEGQLEAARDFGGRLFDAVFEGEMLGCLRASIVRAASEDRGLRLRLRLDDDAAELGELPWELLYYRPLDRFFSLSSSTPLTRYLEMPEGVDPLLMEPPLRMLVAVATPADQGLLDVEREWSVIDDALSHLENAGYLAVDRLESATLPSLQARLSENAYHIFHFIGHGFFDESTDTGYLAFETENGRAQPVTGSQVGALLHDHRTLRLAVLNACVGARTRGESQFRGVAQRLVQQGIPAVIANQANISDIAAIALSSRLYAALAAGFAIDAALAEGRKAVFALGDSLEWATPVLHLRAQDARLFDFGGRAGERPEPGEREAGVPRVALEGDAKVVIDTALGEAEIRARDPRLADIDSVFGDLVGGDKIIHGDQVSGDKITIGTISNSQNVAIGRGAQAGPGPQTASPFEAVRRRLDETPLDDAAREEAAFAVRQLEKLCVAPEPDVAEIDRWLSALEEAAPAAVEAVVSAVKQPAPAVSAGARLAIKTWHAARRR